MLLFIQMFNYLCLFLCFSGIFSAKDDMDLGHDEFIEDDMDLGHDEFNIADYLVKLDKPTFNKKLYTPAEPDIISREFCRYYLVEKGNGWARPHYKTKEDDKIDLQRAYQSPKVHIASPWGAKDRSEIKEARKNRKKYSKLINVTVREHERKLEEIRDETYRVKSEIKPDFEDLGLDSEPQEFEDIERLEQKKLDNENKQFEIEVGRYREEVRRIENLISNDKKREKENARKVVNVLIPFLLKNSLMHKITDSTALYLKQNRDKNQYQHGKLFTVYFKNGQEFKKFMEPMKEVMNGIFKDGENWINPSEGEIVGGSGMFTRYGNTMPRGNYTDRNVICVDSEEYVIHCKTFQRISYQGAGASLGSDSWIKLDTFNKYVEQLKYFLLPGAQRISFKRFMKILSDVGCLTDDQREAQDMWAVRYYANLGVDVKWANIRADNGGFIPEVQIAKDDLDPPPNDLVINEKW